MTGAGTRPVVLILGASEQEPPPGITAVDASAELRYAPGAGDVAAGLAEADVVFFWRGRRAWLEDAWASATRLRWIQTASDGVDGLLFPTLVDAGVAITNARGIFDGAIAEWAIAAILAFATGLRTSVVDTAEGRWDEDRSRRRVPGTRLVVVGPGPIGRGTAVRALALGMTVDAVGRTAREDEVFGRIRGADELHAALAEADHVLDALPLTRETRGTFDRAAFASLKPGATFLNVGRGATVDEQALIQALRDGRVGAAALDVFEEEPLPADSPLWTLPNVIVSPHVCGDVEGWEREVVDLFADNLGRFVRDEPLRNPVDPGLGFGVG
ncbi:MAG: D-2-hydroxyacid dehydrogenase [Actinomycetota bacterium]